MDSQKLLDVGFKKIGCWTYLNSNLEYIVYNKIKFLKKNSLYSFVVSGDEIESVETIKYIGKTTQSLKTRFLGYLNPGKSQQTNKRINKNIIHSIKNNNKVEIYSLSDISQIRWGEYNLNIPSGLEDSLVFNLSPEWNKSGKNKLLTSSETIEKELFKNDISEEIYHSFKIKLGKTYYHKGYINPGLKSSEFFKKDGVVFIKIENELLESKIDRESNKNGSVRLYFGRKLSDWYKKKYEINDTILVNLNVIGEKHTITFKN